MLVLGLVVLGGLAVAAVYLLGGGNNKSPVQAAADTAGESGSTATAANNQGREQPPRLGEKKDAPGVSRPPTPDADGDTASWSPLFNGKDLTGWRTVGASRGEWRVSDGAVTFTGGANDANDRHLVSTRADLGDFRLRFEVMVSDRGHGHICFRATPKGATVAGYVVQINSTHPWSTDKTGSLFTMAGERKGRSLAAVRQTATRSDVWVPMQVTATGNRIVVAVEGRVVVDHTDASHSYSSGSVVLLQPYTSDGTKIKYRNIEVSTRTPGAGH